MFQGMNVNRRVNATTGLAVHGGFWGILRNIEAETRTVRRKLVSDSAVSKKKETLKKESAVSKKKETLKKKKKDTVPQARIFKFRKSAAEVLEDRCAGSTATKEEVVAGTVAEQATGQAAELEIIKLGPKGTEYTLAADATKVLTDNFAVVLHEAAIFQEPWPAEDPSADPRPFFTALGEFYARSRRGSVGTYGSQHFTRWFVAFLERRNPSWLDSLTYSDVEMFLPDEKEQVIKHFSGLMTAPLSTTRQRTDLAFWELSMWSCLLSVDAAAPLVERLADVAPDAALEWRRCVLEAEHLSDDSWTKWPLTVPSTLATWAALPCTKAAVEDDAEG
jgi:hypothetical protein